MNKINSMLKDRCDCDGKIIWSRYGHGKIILWGWCLECGKEYKPEESTWLWEEISFHQSELALSVAKDIRLSSIIIKDTNYVQTVGKFFEWQWFIIFTNESQFKEAEYVSIRKILGKKELPSILNGNRIFKWRTEIY